MDENEFDNLDVDYKRYLNILTPYLDQIVDQNVKDICNSWIQRLSDCCEDEKALRNKYIFTLCFQLAKGILDESFLKPPPQDKLQPLSESGISIQDSDLECIDVDFEKKNPEIKYIKDVEVCKKDFNENFVYDLPISKDEQNVECLNQQNCEDKQILLLPETRIRAFCPTSNTPRDIVDYGHRAKNLVIKLREMKRQNVLLHYELEALKEESYSKPSSEEKLSNAQRLTNTTASNHDCNEGTDTTINVLRNKLKNMQEYTDSLIDTIHSLRGHLEHSEEIKHQEIKTLVAKQALEIITMKLAVKTESKEFYEKNIEELRKNQENYIVNIKDEYLKTIREIKKEKDTLCYKKDAEIKRLQRQVEELRDNLQSATSKVLDKTRESEAEIKSYKEKVQQLENKLIRIEKFKKQTVKAFEAKLAYFQGQKHMTDCSVQLQLVRQRAQMVNEIIDENRTEVKTAIDKLELKYKDIVASMQATAIQRRIQDQTALDSILQAACGLTQTENIFQRNCSMQGTNNSRFSSKTAHDPNTTTSLNCGDEISSLLRGGKIRNRTGDAGIKSFEEGSLRTGYCLDSERLGELFGRVYIPQRDTEDGPQK